MTDYNAADPKHIRAAKADATVLARQDLEYTVHIMSTLHGRAWMWRRLEAAHVFASSFTGNANQTAFLEGERNMGLLLLNLIMTACPEQYVQAAREHNERSSAADSRRNPRRDRDDSEPTSTEPDYSADPDSDDDPARAVLNLVDYDNERALRGQVPSE